MHQTPPPWPPPHSIAWPPASPPSAPSAPDLHMTLGRLLERSERTGDDVSEIKDQLKRGASRMDGHELRLHTLEQHRGKGKRPGAAERWSKDVLRWLIPLGVAWATGGVEAVQRLLAAMGK